MKRSKPLGADPERVRAFQRRGREKPLKRGRPKAKARLSPEVKEEVDRRSEGVCVQVGCGNRGTARHHVLPQWRWPEVAHDPDGIVLVCIGCHDELERAIRRLPMGALPGCALGLARSLGPPAEAFVERTYPTEGDG